MAALIVSGVCFVCVHGPAGMAALIVFCSMFLCVCMEVLAWLHS